MKKSLFLPVLFLFLFPGLMVADSSRPEINEAKIKRAKAWKTIRRIGSQGSGILALQDAETAHKSAIFSGGKMSVNPRQKDELIPSSLNIFLIRVKEKLFLVDTGFGGKKGLLSEKLALLEVKKEKISGILLTHIHPDHIGGLLLPDRQRAAYPEAILYLSRKEYNWNIRKAAPLYPIFSKIRNAYKGRIKLLSGGEKVQGLFTALDAAGHTPGHMVFQYKNILFAGDLLHGASLQFADPEICASYDMDRKGATAARKKFFELIAAKDLTIAGAHIPFPGTGRLQKEGASFIFLPDE